MLEVEAMKKGDRRRVPLWMELVEEFVFCCFFFFFS